MLTNTTETGTARLPRLRAAMPAPSAVSPSAERRAPRRTRRLGRHRRVALAWAALALLGLLAHPPPASAQDTSLPTGVPETWSLKPAGLARGDKFRLLFLSSTRRTAEATDIATYNTFVQQRAAAGHSDIRAYSEGFRVVGCTPDTDARDNTSTTYTATDKGVRIYWLNGAKAADEYEDFYDGSWDDEANDKNESGTDGPDTSSNLGRPITGCSHNGTENFQVGTSKALGEDQVRVGKPNDSGSGNGPLASNAVVVKSLSRPMYGLSEVFQVNPPLWSATLTVRVIGGSGYRGCSNVIGAVACRNSSNLDDSTFTDSSTDYAVTVLLIRPGPGRLDLAVSPDFVSGTDRLTLVVDDQHYFALSDGKGAGSGSNRRVWHNSGLSWSVNDTVTVKLFDLSGAPPLAPATPVVTAVPGTTDSLAVSWSAPANPGRPAITSYDVQYRAGSSGAWTDGPQNVTGTAARLSGLQAGTDYQVRVRATNTNGDSGWSDPPGSGRPNTTAITPQALVSNLGQTTGGRNLLSTTYDVAQEFTTGHNGAGYTLSSIEVRLNDIGPVNTNYPTVKVFSGSANGTRVATLRAPSTDAANGHRNYTYTAPANVTLAGGTSYWVVYEGSSGDVSLTTSVAQDATPRPGLEHR